MAGERNVEEAIEFGRAQALPKAFTEPNRFREELESYGIRLGEDEPIGVADSKTIEAELRRLGVAPKFVRSAARAISSQLNEQNYPRRLFSGVDRHVIIEPGKVGGERFVRRSDLSNEAAHVRLGAYRLVLEEEAERLALEAERESAAAIAERNRPSTATLLVITTFTLEEYRRRVRLRQEKEIGRVVVEEMPHDIEGGIETLPRIIDRADAAKILENGLTAEQLDALIIEVREAIKWRVSEDEKANSALIEAILINLAERIKQPGEDVQVPIYIPRDVVRTIFNSLRDANTNPNVMLELELEIPREGTLEPFPRFLAGEWSERYYKEDLDQISQRNPEVGRQIANLLLDDEVELKLKELRLHGRTTIGTDEINSAELDAVLSEVVLDDETVMHAILADLIGELFPVVYHPRTTGEKKEVNLSVVRDVAEMFSMEQIRNLLRPQVVVKEVPQLDRLITQLQKMEADLAQLTGGDRNVVQRRRSIEGQIAQAKRKIDSLERQKVMKVSIVKLLTDQIAARLATEIPRGRDFTGAEKSEGYKRAAIRYELKKDAYPDRSSPDPDDFVLGAESAGFQTEVQLYNGYMQLVTESWIRGQVTPNDVRGIHKGLALLVVPTMMAAGVFEKVSSENLT